MATTPTNNPIPSESPIDLAFNAGKIDEEVNSVSDYYTDRFGIQRLTNSGRSHQFATAVSQVGYITLDSFQAGATITLPNQVLRDTSTGEYYRWDGAFPKVVASGSTPTSTGGIGTSKWLSVGDAILRANLASSAVGMGDALITVKQPYTGSVSTNQHEVNKMLVSILDFGGKGDGIFDNAIALQNASAAVGEMGTIYFPALGGNNYVLGTTTNAGWTSNRVIKTDPTVIISTVDGGYISSSARFATKLTLHYTNQDVYFYYPQSLGYDKADRPVWTSPSDRDMSVVKRVFPNSSDLSVGVYYRQFNTDTDVVTTITPTATSESGFIITNSNNNQQSIGFTSIADGEEFSCHFDSPSSSTTTLACVMVNCSAGRVWYNCVANDTGNPVRNIRTGGSVITGAVNYAGMNDSPAYKFFMGDITVRRNSPTSFTLMVNGMSIDTVDVISLGEIRDIGFGAAGTGTLTVSSTTRRTNISREVGRFLQVCCFGDSISSDSLGASWPSVLGNSFDAMNGIRLSKVDNFSRPGDDSAAQRTIMNTVNLGNYNICLIMVGVNDIQGGVVASTYLANMRYMISNSLNNGNAVIVAVPTIYYGQAQVSGKGQPTSRAGLGKYHRAGLRNLCAELGVKFIEMNQIIGPVLPAYITDISLKNKDSTVNDNIHPTANTSYLFARAFYNAILGWAAPGGTLNTSYMTLGGDPGSQWTLGTGGDTPRWSRDSDGTITLDGLLNWSGVGAPSSGYLIYRLPTNLRPRFVTRQIVWADSDTARVLINDLGEIGVYAMPTGRWLSLSGISYKGVI